MKSLAEIKTAGMTEIIKVIMMVLAFEKWLLEAVTVLNLTDTALAAVIVQN